MRSDLCCNLFTCLFLLFHRRALHLCSEGHERLCAVHALPHDGVRYYIIPNRRPLRDSDPQRHQLARPASVAQEGKGQEA